MWCRWKEHSEGDVSMGEEEFFQLRLVLRRWLRMVILCRFFSFSSSLALSNWLVILSISFLFFDDPFDSFSSMLNFFKLQDGGEPWKLKWNAWIKASKICIMRESEQKIKEELNAIVNLSLTFIYRASVEPWEKMFSGSKSNVTLDLLGHTVQFKTTFATDRRWFS